MSSRGTRPKTILLAPLRPGEISNPVVVASEISKTYGHGDNAVTAVRNVSLEIGAAQLTALMGPSGSGKSTLMHCLAGLDSPTQGTISLDDSEITNMSEKQLTKLRRDKIGFIFQAFNLIPTLTAQENIVLPSAIAKRKIDPERLRTITEAVGLTDRLTHRPTQLSGGQQQRVACARALITEPAVIFADEPTGNLDSQSSTKILQILRQAVDEFQQTVVMVTHDPGAAAWADRVIFLADGAIVAELLAPTRETILDAQRTLGEADESEPNPAAIPSIAAPKPPPCPVQDGPGRQGPSVTLEIRRNTDNLEQELAPSHLEDALDRIAPLQALPPETVRILDQAQQILEELPGSVLSADGQPPDQEAAGR